MDRDLFWEIVHEARHQGSDDPARVAALTGLLEQRSRDEIAAFRRIQAELMAESHSWPLWGAGYVINGGCSDDGFDYFRGWLLLQGRDVWESALRDPEVLASIDVTSGEAECEEVLYAASVAYDRVAPGDGPLDIMMKLPPKPSGEPWVEEDLPGRFPVLWERFGGRGVDVEAAIAESADDMADGHLFLGMRLLGQERYEEALAKFERARELTSGSLTRALATNNAAWALLMIGTSEASARALPLAEMAVEQMAAAAHRDRNAANYLDYARGTLAYALIDSGRHDEGVAMMKPVLERTGRGEVWALRQCVLAIGLARSGDRASAAALVKDVRASEPTCPLLARASKAVGLEAE